MREKMFELLNTFSDYYNQFEFEVEDNVDFVKSFLNLERLEVEFNENRDNWWIDHSELPPDSAWTLEQQAVWQAFQCACQVVEDPFDAITRAAQENRRAIRYLLHLCLEEEEQVEDVPGAGK